MKKSSPVVELKLPVLPDMELSATKTAEVVAKHMELSEEKSAEISMALIEACINAFEHSGSDKQIEIHFRINDDQLEIQVIIFHLLILVCNHFSIYLLKIYLRNDHKTFLY